MMRGPVLYEDRLVRQIRRRTVIRKLFVVGSMGFAMLSLVLWMTYFWRVSASPAVNQPAVSCNTVNEGNQCFPQTSHLWGQYSPFFSLANVLPFSSPDIPSECRVTFAQVLSRHGARYPTESKSEKYAQLIAQIQKNATTFTGPYAFLTNYTYALGSDNLTTFGENQLVDSGAKFYQRYAALARRNVPFIRASGSDRVIASGEKFIEGFQQAKTRDSGASGNQTAAPVINVVIPETDGFNNTLDHGVCTAFEKSEMSDQVEARFMAVFTPAIRRRLEAGISGVKLSDDDVVSLMDLCSFETVAATPDASKLSPFCDLFSHGEWVQYDYFRSLSKYYGYGAGNPLGPAQGIGFTNELIARLTKSPVHDHTSTNRTLDSNPATFPVDAALYADFSHDNLMVSAFFALGLYNGTKPLSQTKVQTIKETDGYSAAWLVPFGARAYIEAMQCRGEPDSLVRVLVNDRVVPLHGCKTDRLGRCKLDDFVRGLSWARSGGNWGDCFN